MHPSANRANTFDKDVQNFTLLLSNVMLSQHIDHIHMRVDNQRVEAC